MLVDGGIQGLTKLVLPPVLLGLGSFGIVGASGGGYLAAFLASLFFMRRRLGFRFDARLVRTPLVEQVRFSAASYISTALALAPIMAIPLITLQQLGAAAVGYFYVAFQIASLLNTLSHQVGEAVFAEVSHEESRFAELLRRSVIIVAVVQLPASVAVAAASGFLLQIFGDSYATHARTLLVVLVVGALSTALNSLASYALKLARRLTHLVLSHILLAAATIGLAAMWASHGLVWIGWAWCIGNLAAGIYGMAAALTSLRSHPAPAPAEPLVSNQEGHRDRRRTHSP
ncbi:O-antigen/teichoic acid export membrane protein [Streptomyces canus]|uniref:lipopolysaccharide biosynthesis protein n=1 Tax=Streptomyces canus TaxID=58343 RepID=UPI002789A385|nr:oligosaccharide flippase family protein [Streptomyces canus]MDQ0597427.1 O-antigen/teichoic acid export membrane protein [Streptomyces canus]